MEIEQIKRNGVPIKTIGFAQKPGFVSKNISHMYYNVNSWSRDCKKIVVNVADDDRTCSHFDKGYGSEMFIPDNSCRFAIVDTETGESHLFGNSNHYYGVMGSSQYFYYTEGAALYRINIYTYKIDRLAACPLGTDFASVPSINEKETLLTVMWLGENSRLQCYFGVFNLKTLEFEDIVKPPFVDLGDEVDHVMINPKYDHLVSLCRSPGYDYYTRIVNDRIWCYNRVTKECRVVYEQKISGHKLMENLTHELWSSDGEGFYFIKFVPEESKFAHGIYYIPKNTTSKCEKFQTRTANDSRLISAEYTYLHAGVSHDGKLMISDVYFEKDAENGTCTCKLILINTATGESSYLCTVGAWYSQPGHVHPNFSPDDTKLTFTFADENGVLKVGIIELTTVYPG